MNFWLFFSLFLSLTLASLWIGKKSGKGLKNNEDYFLAGRDLKIFPLAMTLLATQLGGGALMGSAEEAYTKGWTVLFYPLGMVLGLVLLGVGFGAKMRKLNLTTVAELFERVYGSPFLRKVASLLSIASLFFILIGQAIAAKKFFISLGFSPDFTLGIFSLFWLTIVAYTVFGGLRGVVNTDILQALFMLLSLAIAFCALFFIKKDFGQEQDVSFSTESMPWLSWLILPLFFMLIEQDMGQRCFAAKKPVFVSMASLLAGGILMVACLCPIYFGCKAKTMGLELTPGESVLLASVKGLTNPTVATFLILAVLMAIVSTVDSLLNSISSNLVFDFPNIQKEGIKLSRLVTLIVGLATFGLSFFFNNVLTMLLFAYDLAVSVLFIPVVFALFLKRPPKTAAILSMTLGLLGFLLFRTLPYKELWTLLLSLSGFTLAYLTTKDPLPTEDHP